MLFKRKKTIANFAEPFSMEEVTQKKIKDEDFSTPAIEVEREEGMEEAFQADREYIDIESPSLYIDVIEMFHFFNELPSLRTKEQMKRNEEAIDFFRKYTHIYVGNAFEFYQTVVFFYYKQRHNPAYPFQGSQLEFVFEKVAKNMSQAVDLAVQEELLAVDLLVENNPYAFYFHEDRIEQHANRFMRNMTMLIPQYDVTNNWEDDEYQFIMIANDIFEDIRHFLYDYSQQSFFEFNTVYTLLNRNNELIISIDPIKIMGLKYLPIYDESSIYIMQQMRVYRLQNILVQGLQQQLATQLSTVKTVKALEGYLLEENEQYYSNSKETLYANQRFITLFFDSYCFENGISSHEDSPKVRSCLQRLVKECNEKQVQNGDGQIEMTMLIKKAYYEHQLMAGN